MDIYQDFKKNHLTMLKTRKQVLSVNTAEEWLLTENSVPVSVCYPLSLCMCVIWSPLNTPMALSVSQMEIEEEKLTNMGSSVRTFPSHLSHTQWKREKTEPGAVSMCSDVLCVCHECVCVCVGEVKCQSERIYDLWSHTHKHKYRRSRSRHLTSQSGLMLHETHIKDSKRKRESFPFP